MSDLFWGFAYLFTALTVLILATAFVVFIIYDLWPILIRVLAKHRI